MRLFVLVSLLVVALGSVAYVVDGNIRKANAEIAAELEAKAAAREAEKAALLAEKVEALQVRFEAATVLLASEEKAAEDALRQSAINKANAEALRQEAAKIAMESAEFKAEAERRIAVSQEQIAEIHEAARTREAQAEAAAAKAVEARELINEYRTTVELLQNEINSLTR